ncbi:MAG: hypothetical protein R6U89_11760 [Dehalococcoidia bacterium]
MKWLNFRHRRETEKLRRLLEMEIDWEEKVENGYHLRAFVDGKEIRLRVNDFPDEVACTLLWAGKTYQIDDFGEHWNIPPQDNEGT